MKLFLLSTILPLLLSGQEPITNIEWIEKNVTSILDSINIAESISDRIVKIELGAVKGEKNGFIKSHLLSFLDVNSSKTVEKNFINLHIEQFNTTIVYEQNSDGFLNLGSSYIRKNRIELVGWLEEFESPIIKSFNVNKVFSEKLKIDNLQHIEKSPYSFTKGESKELSLWTSTIEPVLVGSSVAFIVYLFFSVRS